jgi:hypothetical protein
MILTGNVCFQLNNNKESRKMRLQEEFEDTKGVIGIR